MVSPSDVLIFSDSCQSDTDKSLKKKRKEKKGRKKRKDESN